MSSYHKDAVNDQSFHVFNNAISLEKFILDFVFFEKTMISMCKYIPGSQTLAT